MSGTPDPQAAADAGTRQIRIAALADTHYDGTSPGGLRDLFAEIDRSADILALCGDLTTHGRADQMRTFVDELVGVHIPIVAVLGNHDYESDAQSEMNAILRDRGVHVLDGDFVVVHDIGFAGTKGFAGGFGRGALAPFGERLIKDFVQAAIDESIKLENALRNLRTETKVVLLHFSPIVDTVLGEPEIIYPFLGSSRLVHPLDTFGASVIFHGHAHHGKPSGATPGGVPVYNVALPLLAENGHRFVIWTSRAPERRHAAEPAPEPPPTARRIDSRTEIRQP
jgi:Icc-related predicted phosphoesterase